MRSRPCPVLGCCAFNDDDDDDDDDYLYRAQNPKNFFQKIEKNLLKKLYYSIKYQKNNCR